MWNSRVTMTVVASLIGLALLCALLGAAYTPYYTDRRSARLTEIEAARVSATRAGTQAAVETQLAHAPTETAVAGATQTEAARPTETGTPTSTPTETPTRTATPPAAIVGCAANVVGTERVLYPVPGGGRVRDAVTLPRDSQVTVIGRLEDGGWLQVQTDDGAVGWMRSDMLNLNPPNCQTNIYDLSYLLGVANGQKVVADDTLISNENGWINNAGEPLLPVVSAYGDAQLVVNTNTEDKLRSSNPVLQDVPVFELATSFGRVNFSTGSYVGVRFRDSGLTYYEVRILRNCQVEVYAVSELAFTRPLDPGENTCVDDQEDWLAVAFSEDNILRVQFNDADSVEIHLDDPAGLYSGGGLEP